MSLREPPIYTHYVIVLIYIKAESHFFSVVISFCISCFVSANDPQKTIMFLFLSLKRSRKKKRHEN
jgi:hypothetical protein